MDWREEDKDELKTAFKPIPKSSADT